MSRQTNMENDNSKNQFNLSREAASKLLKISMRTLDRYIKLKKLSAQVINGRIWLNKKEIDTFKIKRIVNLDVDNIDMSTLKLSTGLDVDNIDNGIDNVDKDDTTNKNSIDILTTHKKKIFHDAKIYKELHDEIREELREKQERLEVANYRVGLLEAQLKNSIPMIEYHREKYEKKKTEEDLKNKLLESLDLIKKLYFKVRYHKFSKWIFIILLLIILLLQPLWLLIIYDL